VTIEVFEVTLDCEVKSKKNNKVPRFRRGRLIGLMENAGVRRSQAQVEGQIMLARKKQQGIRPALVGGPVWERKVSLELHVHINRDDGTTKILVRPIGEEPKRGRNGKKRDIQNELALICDALQGAGICENDSQFARIIIERQVQGETR